MKKFVSIFLSVMLCMAFVCPVSGAALLEFSFDKVTGSLSLSGSIGSAEHQACLVYIFDACENVSDLSDSNTPVFADVATTNAGGTFEYSKVLANTYPSGKYRIRVVSGQESWDAEFMYTNKQSVSNLLSLVNGVTTATSLEKIISSSATELGIDTNVYNPVKDNVAIFVFGNKPDSGFTTADGFINVLEQSMAAAIIKAGADTASVLKEKAKAFAIDFDDDYNKFDSSVKQAINSELVNTNEYSKKLLSELYPELRALAFVKVAPTWQALKNAVLGVDNDGNVIVSNYSVIKPDLSIYNKVVNKDKVFAEMFRQRENLTSLENIRSAFLKCSLSVFNNENKESSSGSSLGGGSFGSGASGPVSIEPGYINQSIYNPAFFVDTDINAWYYSSLEKLVVNSLINGYEDKSFRPDNPITRAEFTKLVVGVAKHTDTLSTSDAQISFDDVAPSDWFADVVITAAQAKLVNGSENKFMPDNLITRQDAAVILHRLISSVKTIDGSVNFEDNANIADYAKEAVSSLAASGIISGMGNGNFAPTENLTRAQAAKLLCSVLENLS